MDPFAVTVGRAILLAALSIGKPVFAEDDIPHCAVHSASRDESISLFTDIADLGPSEISERNPDVWTPRFREGLFATGRHRKETVVTNLRIVGSDWTMVDGLHIGMHRAVFLDRHGAVLDRADSTLDRVEFEWPMQDSDFGSSGCLIAVTFDDDDRVSELAMSWYYLRIHPDPPPENN